MTILGIDPGYDRLGWGVIEKKNNTFTLLGCGIIQTPKTDTDPSRLSAIHRQLTAVVGQYKPGIAAVEGLFFSKNKTSVIQVAQARGVILSVLDLSGVSIEEYTPSQIKSSVTGNGQADKKMVEKMLRLQLKNVPEKLLDDTIDALAIALASGTRTY